MDLMELIVKITMDSSEYENGLNDASSKASSFASKLGGGLKTAAKVGAAAVKAASEAVTAVTKSAVEGYADYEQLAGGIETLFGDSAQKVISDADNAFKTAGLSANEYMETSIESAAALINSLGGDQEKAADMMNMSITDMADNVNKMGTTMEGVQNAYRGFSRGNFTMLDNLALGFAGTKEGMQELLDKAQEFSGIEYDIESYSDIVEAIHVVQGEMGISGRTAEEAAEIIARTGRSSDEVFEQLGTTAKEANTTISGSVASMKSAWSNLVTGFANDDADLDNLIGNFVDSAETAFNNILPVAEKALDGIVSFIEKIAPVIAEKLPGLVERLLPDIFNAAVNLFNALANALPDLIHVIIERLPTIIDTFVTTILDLLPEIIKLGLELILALAQGLSENLDTLIPAVVDVILEIVDILTEPDMILQLVNAALQIILALAKGLIDALPKLIEKAPEIVMNLVEAIVEAAPMILEAATELIFMLISGIADGWSQIYDIGEEIVNKVQEGFMGVISNAVQWGKDLISNFISGITGSDTLLGNAVSGAASKIKSFLHFSEPDEGPLSDFHTYAPDMMDLFAKGIRDNEKLVTDQIEKSFDFSDIIANVGGNGMVGAIAQQSTASTPTWADILGNLTIVQPVYIGGDKVDEKIISAIDAYNYRSGGR